MGVFYSIEHLAGGSISDFWFIFVPNVEMPKLEKRIQINMLINAGATQWIA